MDRRPWPVGADRPDRPCSSGHHARDVPRALRKPAGGRSPAPWRPGGGSGGYRHGPLKDAQAAAVALIAELRGTATDTWFIEVAARSIGGYCSHVLQFEGGLSLEDVILRHALDPRTELPEREEQAAGVMMIQSPRKGIFVEVRGLEAARAVSHVEDIMLSAHPGQALSPLPEGFLYAGFIFARGDAPESVEASLREAFGKIEFVFEAPS